jgi:hypothetical protein
VGDLDFDEEEWERSDAGRAFLWLVEHPERVELFGFAPEVAVALGETSDEVWVWAEGAERLEPETRTSSGRRPPRQPGWRR